MQHNTCVNYLKKPMLWEKEILDQSKAIKQGTSKGALHMLEGLMLLYLMI